MLKQKQSASSLFISLIFIFFSTTLHSQSWKSDRRVNLLFGLSQPLVASGINVEGNFIFRRLIFDYSHGAGLSFKENSVTTDLKRQGLAVYIPFTTGFGVGYRLKEWLNVRLEPKWHKFEFYNQNDARTDGNIIASLRTFSLGLGFYGDYRPFKTKSSFIKGFLISPSVRYWPTIKSSIGKNGLSYSNSITRHEETIKTLDPGILFSPLVLNVSVGYSFDLVGSGRGSK